VALNPKFAQSVAQALANFGFATLDDEIRRGVTEGGRYVDDIRLMPNRIGRNDPRSTRSPE
jgi:hypothetical protein